MLTRREQLILLNLLPELGPLRLRRLLEAFGDLDGLWRASARDLERVNGLGPRAAARIAAIRQDDSQLRDELALAARHGVTILTREEPAYPVALTTIPDPPLALYVRGTLTEADAVAVGIVGTRRASVYGLTSAERLGAELAGCGITVVSGLARGIDAAAHRGALTAGRTLAVLGSGLARLYPPEHAELAERVAAKGAVLSEYPMDTPPLPLQFPRRNRLISGLSLGVVIVEAAQRSGALITADCALEQGREVFAVPGPMRAVTSQGTHQLLKQGARLVTSVDDIVQELRLDMLPSAAAGRTPYPADEGVRLPSIDAAQDGVPSGVEGLPEAERKVLACLREQEPRDIDAIAADSGLELPDVSSLLLQMELKHLVRQLPGKQFVRHPLEPAACRSK